LRIRDEEEGDLAARRRTGVGDVSRDVDDTGLADGAASDAQVRIREGRVAETVAECESWRNVIVIEVAIAKVVVHRGRAAVRGPGIEWRLVVLARRPGDGQLAAEVRLAEEQLAERRPSPGSRVPGLHDGRHRANPGHLDRAPRLVDDDHRL